MRKRKGAFITFEGTGEGVGKSTQAVQLAGRLKAEGHEVILTKEPGGTELGKQLRQLLLHSEVELSKATELFLMMADRAQHFKEVLKPALKDGKIIICDRYLDSTLVYQGSGRGWKTAFLWRLHHACTGSLLPDLTFVLDGVPHRERFKDDRFEKLDDSFHRKVKRGMLHLASKSDRYVLLNANVDETDLAQKILGVVRDRLLPNP